MRIDKMTQEETGKETQQETRKKSPQERSGYIPVAPAILDSIPEDVTFIHSTDVCKLLNISNSTLRNLRAAQAIPFYKLGGTFLYSKEEIMNYLANNYSRRI